VAKIGIHDINTTYEKLSGLYEKFEALLSRLPQHHLSLRSVPATIPDEQDSHNINPVMNLGSPIKETKETEETIDPYAQPISILFGKSGMTLKSSTRLINESNHITAKITHLLQAAPQLGDGLISSKSSSLKTEIEQFYQLIEQLKKEIDSIPKEHSSKEVLNQLSTLVSKVQDQKIKLVNAKENLSKVLESLFELLALPINVIQKERLFANQIYVASSEFTGKIVEAQKQYNDLSKQFYQYNVEDKSIKKEFDSLWKDKEIKRTEIAAKINLLNVLKNEKIVLLQQQLNNALDPLWSLAVDKHHALIETIENRPQGVSKEAVAQELNHLKNEGERKFKEINELHQGYQSKMPSDKLLSESFDKNQKEVNIRLKEMMLEMYTFAEQQEKN
jgi:hypothetical protein